MAHDGFKDPAKGKDQPLAGKDVAHSDQGKGHRKETQVTHIKLMNLSRLPHLTKEHKDQIVQILRSDLDRYSSSAAAASGAVPKVMSAMDGASCSVAEVEYRYCKIDGALVWCRCELITCDDGSEYWDCEPATVAAAAPPM
jgi:hypothetical protein